MTNLSIMIILFAICVIAALAIAAWNKPTRWVASLLVPILSWTVYFGWGASKDLLGLPTDKEPEGEWMLIGGMIDQPNYIYLTILPKDKTAPVLVRYIWSDKKEKTLTHYLKLICEGQTIMGNSKKRGEGSEQGQGQQRQGSGDHNMDSEFVFYEFNAQRLPPKR